MRFHRNKYPRHTSNIWIYCNTRVTYFFFILVSHTMFVIIIIIIIDVRSLSPPDVFKSLFGAARYYNRYVSLRYRVVLGINCFINHLCISTNVYYLRPYFQLFLSPRQCVNPGLQCYNTDESRIAELPKT